MGVLDVNLISIIIPVYNSENYLRDCLESVVNQTYRNLEIILVDDASTDSSGKICDEIAQADNRIKVIHHENNRGLSLSKYDGYMISTGDWISFVDNDDLVALSMYEELIAVAISYRDANIICFAGEDIKSKNIRARLDAINSDASYDNFRIKQLNNLDACKTLYGHTDIRLRLNGIFSATWGKIIRRELFGNTLKETIEYKDKLYWLFLEDVLFIPICVYKSASTVFVEKISYLHRLSDANLSSRLRPSEYHYETVVASDIVQEYFRINGLEKVADDMLEGLLLNIQSVWYKIYRYEDNITKKSEGLTIIDFLWKKYIKKYFNCKSSQKSITKAFSIYIFVFNKKLWLHTVGDLHFKK